MARIRYSQAIYRTPAWELWEGVVLVQSKFIVQAVKLRGIGVEQLVEHRGAKEGIQLYQSTKVTRLGGNS